ncbi:MAG: hypothetical protein L6R48_21905 [Planctomycetes bacterium]|nr:hypothetical protein [Planctomycetota bacterium]
MTRRSALLWLLAAALAAEEPARHAGARVLERDGLRLEVMDPDAPERYHRGVRFTPLAAVLRASRGGHEFLYNPIEHDPQDDHAGLAAEFDLCIPGGPAADLPPGFAAAPVGGSFLKVGVGVLRKHAPDYHLFHRPPLVAAAATTAAWEAARVLYRQDCRGPGDLAYRLDALLRLEDGGVVAVDWTLANTGSAAFATRQYSHNFLRFDGHDVGPGYELTFPHPVACSPLNPEQRLDGSTIRFEAPIPTWLNAQVEAPPGVAAACTLAFPAAGLSTTCTTSIPIQHTAIHARAGYVAPEQFVRLELAPGEARSWTRSYRFAVAP